MQVSVQVDAFRESKARPRPLKLRGRATYCGLRGRLAFGERRCASASGILPAADLAAPTSCYQMAGRQRNRSSPEMSGHLLGKCSRCSLEVVLGQRSWSSVWRPRFELWIEPLRQEYWHPRGSTRVVCRIGRGSGGSARGPLGFEGEVRQLSTRRPVFACPVKKGDLGVK